MMSQAMYAKGDALYNDKVGRTHASLTGKVAVHWVLPPSARPAWPALSSRGLPPLMSFKRSLGNLSSLLIDCLSSFTYAHASIGKRSYTWRQKLII